MFRSELANFCNFVIALLVDNFSSMNELIILVDGISGMVDSFLSLQKKLLNN